MMNRKRICTLVTLMLMYVFNNSTAVAQFLSQQDIAKLPAAPADHRIKYGKDPMQFGDLRLPKGKGPHPVAIVIHGGCWLSAFADLQLTAPLSDALARAGIATWNVEFRPVDKPGGGWTGTLLDVANAVDYVRELAKKHPFDLKRVVVIGNSAGGHLALWSAARHRLPKESPLFINNPLPMLAAFNLGGISDLKSYLQESVVCGKPILKLVGGLPDEVPERYKEASPIEMLPLGVKQVLITGAQDKIVLPKNSKDYADAARKSGDDVQLIVLENTAHFEVIAPGSTAWTTVEKAVLSVLDTAKKAEVRPPTEKELKATLVLSLPLEEASAKIRTGNPVDDEEDYALDVWAGVIPVRLTAGEPVADDRLKKGIPIPPHVSNYKNDRR